MTPTLVRIDLDRLVELAPTCATSAAWVRAVAERAERDAEPKATVTP